MSPALQPFMEHRITNYLPSCAIDKCLMHKYNTLTQAQYRDYVKHHAEQVMADLQNPSVCHSRLQ